MTQQIVYFNSRDKLIRLDIQKIVYFEGDGNYTYIVTANKQKVCVTMNLSHTEDALATQLGDNAKEWSLGTTGDGSMFSYSLSDKQLTVKFEDYPNYHFFDSATYTRPIWFNITTQDDKSASRTTWLKIIQEPNRTWLPVKIDIPYNSGITLTPENIKILGNKFMGDERMEIDVESLKENVANSAYDHHCIIHMVITPRDTHETYNFTLDSSFEIRDHPGTASSRVNRAKYISLYDGHYTVTGVMESVKENSRLFNEYRAALPLNLVEVKSADGIVNRYNWDWSGKTPQQITTADITYLTITLQDMTKPGGQ